MTFAQDWAELLTWAVDVQSPTGNDAYGNTALGPATTVMAHVDRVVVGDSRSSRAGISSTEPTNDGTIYLPPDTAVDPGTVVTFPDGTVVNLTSVTLHYDEDGVAHHYEATWEVD